MKNKISRWLAPPVFEDDTRKNWYASLLNAILITIVLLVTLIIIGSLLGGKTTTTIFVLDGVIIAIFLLLRRLLFSNKVKLTGVLSIVFVFIMLTAIIIAQGTIRTPAPSVFLLTVIIAGLLFGRNGIIITTISSSLIILGLILAENASLLPSPESAVTITRWVTYTSLFGLTGALTYFSHHTTMQLLEAQFKEVAARKQTEETLRQSERKHRILAENSMDMIWTADLDSNFTYISPAIEHHLGYSSEEALSLKLEDLLPPASIAKVTNIMSKLLVDTQRTNTKENALTLHTTEIENIHKNGSIIPFEVSTSFLLNEDNEPIGIMGTSRNIIKRKEAERRLREYREHLEELVDKRTHSLNEEIEQHKQTTEALQINEERLRTLINSTPDIICFKDGQGRWLEANDAILELFALTDVDYYNKTDSELAAFTAPLYKEAFLDCEVSDEKTWQKKSIARGIEIIPTLDGTEKVYDVIKVPLFEADETRKGLVVLGRDITEREQIREELEKHRQHLEALVIARTADLAHEVEQHRQAKNALQESEMRFRMLFEAAPDGITVLDKEGFIIESNPASLHLHNRPLDEMMGRRINEFIDPSLEEMLEQHTLPNLRQLNHQEKELQIIRSNGNRVDVWRKKTPLTDAEGNFNGILTYDRDITVLKQAEAELLQAKKEAETANQAKSAFLSNMSHELRTPLNGILGYTQIFKRDTTLTTQQQRGIDVIHRSGEYLLVMINDILDLSKIEANRMELVPIEFHLPTFVQSLVHMIRPRVEQKELLFNYQPDPDLPASILADKTRLRQILLNLLSNAIKFTEQGSVTLRVQRNGNKPSSLIRFEVEDSGVGIPLEQQASIFEPFCQIGDEQVMHQGTGLGLAISQRLVRMMGGDLHVESDGTGSRFWFEIALPSIISASDGKLQKENQKIGYTRTTETSLPPATSPFKILVVDDFEPNRTVLNILLTSLGFIVGEAGSALDGIRQLSSFKPDFIFMDLIMPDINGLEATRQIRRHPNGGQLPIIALSANLNAGVQQECLVAGCDGYLPKPFEADAVLEKLQQHLPLQWLYVDEDAQSEDQALILPPKKDMTEMLELSKYGDIGGIKKHVEKLKQEDTRYAPFVKQIGQLVAGYKMREIQKYLQGCLDLE